MNKFEYILLILSGIIYSKQALNLYDLLPPNGLVSQKTFCLSGWVPHILLVCIISIPLSELSLGIMKLFWDYDYYQPWTDNEQMVEEMLAMRNKANKDNTVMLPESFQQKYNKRYKLYPWLSLLEPKTFYKPQT